MKTLKLLIVLTTCLMTLGVFPNNDNDNNNNDLTLYLADLPTVTVTADMLEGFVPKRASSWSREEFIKLNSPIIKYVAKHTWMSEGQVYALLRQEQGRGSYLLTKHNNPFNIKGKNGVKAVSWEYTQNNKVTSSFASFKTIQEGLIASINLINGRYAYTPTDNASACYHIYRMGWHTDPNVKLRIGHANYYDKLTV